MNFTHFAFFRFNGCALKLQQLNISAAGFQGEVGAAAVDFAFEVAVFLFAEDGHGQAGVHGSAFGEGVEGQGGVSGEARGDVSAAGAEPAIAGRFFGQADVDGAA